MARTTTNGWLGTRVALAAAALVAGGALVASTSAFAPAMAWAEETPAAEQGQDGAGDGTTEGTTYDNTATTITGSYYLASAESIVPSLQASNAQLVESDALVTQAQKRAAQCAAAGIHSAQNENECVAYLASADVQNPVTDVATMTQNWFAEGSALLNTAYNYVGTALFQAENGDLYLVTVLSTDAGTTGTEGKVEPVEGSGMQEDGSTEVPVTVTVNVEGTSEQPAAEDGIEPQALEWTLTYDANGGEGTMDPVSYNEGTEVTLAECAFTAPEGKQFKGWATSAEGTETVTSVTMNGETTVYAIWEDVPATQYTLTYDANGGEGTMDPVAYDEGTEVTLAECAFTAPEGKQFKGWATSADGTEAVTSVTITENTTVYAIWEDVAKAQVTAYYDANGGSGEMGNIVVDEGDSATLSTCGFTAPEGKQFKCWSTDPEGQTTYNAGDPIAVTDGMKIYAIWEDAPKTQVTVTFDANGGEGAMDAVTVDQGTTVTLPTNTFTRSGYTFAGWNTQADGNGSSYVNGGSVTLGANLTLYAKWTTEKYITGIQNNLKATTTAGVKPTLPATASIRWSDGSTTSESVTWTEPENYAAKYAQAGTFQVSGTVKGYSIKCTVTVNAASNGTSGTTNNGGTTNGTTTGGTTTDATAQNANGTATAQDQSALAKTGDTTDYTPIAIAGGVGLVVVILAVVLILKSRKSN